MLMLIMQARLQLLILMHFNTSHVNVNHIPKLGNALNGLNFNTSHVNVNQNSIAKVISFKLYFNTSHVNVNPQ